MEVRNSFNWLLIKSKLKQKKELKKLKEKLSGKDVKEKKIIKRSEEKMEWSEIKRNYFPRMNELDWPPEFFFKDFYCVQLCTLYRAKRTCDGAEAGGNGEEKEKKNLEGVNNKWERIRGGGQYNIKCIKILLKNRTGCWGNMKPPRLRLGLDQE